MGVVLLGFLFAVNLTALPSFTAVVRFLLFLLRELMSPSTTRAGATGKPQGNGPSTPAKATPQKANNGDGKKKAVINRFYSPSQQSSKCKVRVYASANHDCFVEVDKPDGNPMFTHNFKMSLFQANTTGRPTLAAVLSLNTFFEERDPNDYHSFNDYRTEQERANTKYEKRRTIFACLVAHGTEEGDIPLSRAANRTIFGKNIAKALTTESNKSDTYKKKFEFQADMTPANVEDRVCLADRATLADTLSILFHNVLVSAGMSESEILRNKPIMRTYFGRHTIAAWHYFADCGKISPEQLDELLADEVAMGGDEGAEDNGSDVDRAALGFQPFV